MGHFASLVILEKVPVGYEDFDLRVFFSNTHDFETCSWIFFVYFFPHIYYKIGEIIFL